MVIGERRYRSKLLESEITTRTGARKGKGMEDEAKQNDDGLVDKDFEGSIFQQLGFQARLCPHCKAHLGSSGVCLNGCTLPGHLYRKLIGGS